jgi:hypothetical protein
MQTTKQTGDLSLREGRWGAARITGALRKPQSCRKRRQGSIGGKMRQWRNSGNDRGIRQRCRQSGQGGLHLFCGNPWAAGLHGAGARILPHKCGSGHGLKQSVFGMFRSLHAAGRTAARSLCCPGSSLSRTLLHATLGDCRGRHRRSAGSRQRRQNRTGEKHRHPECQQGNRASSTGHLPDYTPGGYARQHL